MKTEKQQQLIDDRDRWKQSAETFKAFFDAMPKGQLGKISCDIGILNDAFVSFDEARRLTKDVEFEVVE